MLATLCAILFAPKHQIFEVKNASPRFSVSADIVAAPPDPGTDLPDDRVDGSGVITLKLKSTGRTFQVIRMSELTVFKRQLAASVAKNGKQPDNYDDDYSFVFEDFNFDGHQDLAICNGMNGGYGLPSYDVFLYNDAKKQFVKSGALSTLATEHLGLFQVEPTTHRLVVFDKSGAAWHQTSWYRLVNNQPILVEREVDDATGSKEVVTTKTKVGQRWRTRVKTMPLPKD